MTDHDLRDLEVTDDVEAKALASRLDLSQSGVEHQQVTWNQFPESRRLLGRIPVGECLKLWIDVDLLPSHLLWDVLGQPMDIPGIGRMALIQDPQGAHVWIFRGAM